MHLSICLLLFPFACFIDGNEATELNLLNGQTFVSRSERPTAAEETQQSDVRVKRAPYFGSYGGWGFSNMLISAETPNEYTRNWITSEHNRYRRMAPATNMRMVYWSNELAASAQRHANRCDFRHSRDRVNVGENIWSAGYTDYREALSIWFNEVNRCGCGNAFKYCCGHYTTMMWAQTNLIGCGFSRCQGYRNYFVCHYSPKGATYVGGFGQMYAVPAFNWAANDSEKCKDCPSDAPACYEGLCYMPTAKELSENNRNLTMHKEPNTNATSAAENSVADA